MGGGSEMDRACGRVGNHQRVSSLSVGVKLYIVMVATLDTDVIQCGMS